MKVSRSLFIAAVLTFVTVIAVQAAPLAGAIFTTTPDGGIVNENVRYNAKIEVYLDGGPGPNAPQTAAGLPDGDYYFQVTDPSGKVLLSQDPAKCREVRIAGGVITELLSIGKTYTIDKNTFPCSVQDPATPPYDPKVIAGVAGPSGRHDTNVDKDHGMPAIVVQLMPFYDTPNPGGVYKAWIIPTARYIANGGNPDKVPTVYKERGKQLGYDRDPGFGPPRDQVKTDNFKVKEKPPMLRIYKFVDTNGNGVQDPGEPEYIGWLITYTETLFDGTTVTNTCYTPCAIQVPPNTSVAVEEDLLSDWELSYVIVDSTYINPPTKKVVVAMGTSDHTVIYGNWKYATKSGYKFHDLNANGTWDKPDELGLSGWTIKLAGTDGKGNSVSKTTVTDNSGKYSFKIPPGTYTVSEVCPQDWYQSFPVTNGACGTGVYSNLTFTSGQVDDDNNFGNYQYATKSGYKFHDLNANGTWDKPTEPALSGWTIQAWQGLTKVAETTTDANGKYAFSLKPGSYTVKEVCPADWYQSYPAPSGTCGTGVYNITLISAQIDGDNNFGNYQYATKSGYKFHDLNANGTWDKLTEPALSGWTIQAWQGLTKVAETKTDLNGKYSFSLKPGSYTVKEVCPADWYQSYPASAGFVCGAGVYNITLISQQQDTDNDFGNFQPATLIVKKFYDANEDKVRQDTEAWLSDVEFCLYDGGNNLVSADDFLANTNQSACQKTDVNGTIQWTDLMPGTYTAKETLPAGWFSTTGTEKTVTLLSGDTKTLYFGNVTNCAGLTPGYWVNWDNHYTSEQFLILLQGTIAEGDINLANQYLTSTGCDDGDAVNCMRRFLLASQLTLNLTQHPELPNPSGGSMYNVCQVPGRSGNLGYWIDQALAILEDPAAYTRDYILEVKSALDAFCNMKVIVGP